MHSRLFFLGDTLYKVIRVDRTNNLVYVHDIDTDERKKLIWSEFKKRREPAYTATDVAKMINRHPQKIRQYRYEDPDFPPGREYWTGRKKFPQFILYSPEDVMSVWRYFAGLHRGRPRKDGVSIPQAMPTEKELRMMLSREGKLLYIEQDGEYVPVWMEK